jgi:hypothetical protein
MLFSSEKCIINERKKIYHPLIPISLDEAQYIKNKWHHACLSAYNLLPNEENYKKKFDLDFSEICNIIYHYGVYPPKNHWYWNEKEKYLNK